MPPSIFLSLAMKQLICYKVFVEQKTYELVFNEIFGGKSSFIPIRHIQDICRDLNGMNDEQLSKFLQPLKKRGGRQPLVTSLQREYILAMLTNRRFSCLTDLAQSFAEEYYIDCTETPTYRTIVNEVHRATFTRKLVERRHILLNHEARLNFLERVAFMNPCCIVDLDETASSAFQFYAKHGWAPSGEKVCRLKIRINNRHYSAIAAYTFCGFMCW
jgi:hypothetical protein